MLDRLDPGLSDNRITLPVFEGPPLELLLDHRETRSETSFTWFGRIAGIGLSDVVLVREDDAIHATVRDYRSEQGTVSRDRQGMLAIEGDLDFVGRQAEDLAGAQRDPLDGTSEADRQRTGHVPGFQGHVSSPFGSQDRKRRRLVAGRIAQRAWSNIRSGWQEFRLVPRQQVVLRIVGDDLEHRVAVQIRQEQVHVLLQVRAFHHVRVKPRKGLADGVEVYVDLVTIPGQEVAVSISIEVDQMHGLGG